MTGWRLGWLTHPADLAPTIAKLVQITTSGVPQFLQRAAVTAIEDGDHVIRDLRARCKAGRALVFDRLASWPRLRLAPPKAAFYAFFAVDGVSDLHAYAKPRVHASHVRPAPGSA